jgi:hypothetical protein
VDVADPFSRFGYGSESDRNLGSSSKSGHKARSSGGDAALSGRRLPGSTSREAQISLRQAEPLCR